MNIPSSWQILPLQKVAKLQTGLALNSKLKILCPVCVPYLRVANVQAGHIELGDLKTVVIESSTMQRFVLHPGDVLLTEGGDFDKLGRGAVWRGQISPCLHQNHVFAIRTDRLKLLPEFLSYQTESNYGRNYFLSCSKQSTNLASINSTQIKNFPVIVPPLNEQRRIAEFLGTWDKAIEKLEQLIAAEEAVLNAYLSRFVSAYESQNIPLGKLDGVKIEKGRSVTKSLLTGGDIPVIAGGKTTPYYCSAYTHDGETVTISASGAYAGYVWYHSGKIWASDCNVLTSSAINVKFIFFALKYQQQRIYSLQSGGAQPHVYAKDIEKILIPMLPRDKQDEIVKILSLFEQKALLHRQELAALQKQKRGLMQKLLTGTWRI